jgi:hypothetical protein
MKLVEQLKQSGQDFEWYPTTNEIIDALVRDIQTQWDKYARRDKSVMDIGAGNGKVLHALRDRLEFTKLYAIEKSVPLLQLLDDEIFIVGTEFHEQSLVSKQVNLTFCNPPYSEFNEWAVKIIRESSSSLVYLVIPTRWAESLEIAAALSYREAKTKIVGTFSFVNAEDRAARAVVNLIRIELSKEKDDAFDRFFDEQFADLKARFFATSEREKDRDRDDEDAAKAKAADNPKFKQLVVGQNYPERMVELYNEQLDFIRANYAAVAKLDADLMREFDVSPARILGCLKARLAGLRNLYWKELFSNMTQVTNRLTSKKRRHLLETLNQSGHVDFTLSNVHAVIIWVLKQANNYIDTQLIETFESMVEKANVRNYVSNQRVFTHDRWRYSEEKPSHIALEYRLVLNHCGGINKTSYSFERGLSDTGAAFIGDLLTVAHNLGFLCNTTDPQLFDSGGFDGARAWKTGETRVFNMKKEWHVGDMIPWGERTRKEIVGKFPMEGGKFQYEIADVEESSRFLHEKLMPDEPLFEVRAFYNSNLHIRLNQKFALALNVEYGRLKGWLRNGAHAAEELGDPEAPKYFGNQAKLCASSLLMLAGPAPAQPHVAA